MPIRLPSSPRSLPNLVASCDLVPAAGDGLADQLLVGERAVHVGGVEERHADVEGALDGLGRLGLVGGPVELAHAHAAQPDGRDGQGGRCRSPGCVSVSASSCRPAYPTEGGNPPHRDLTGTAQAAGSRSPTIGAMSATTTSHSRPGTTSDQRPRRRQPPRGPAARRRRRAEHPRAARGQPAVRRLRGGHRDQRPGGARRGAPAAARPGRARRDDARHGRLRGGPAAARRGRPCRRCCSSPRGTRPRTRSPG